MFGYLNVFDNITQHIRKNGEVNMGNQVGVTELPSCHFLLRFDILFKSLRHFLSCKTNDLNLNIFTKLS